MKSCTRPVTILLAFIPIVMSVLAVSCVMRPPVDHSKMNLVTCKYTFSSTEREDADRIARVVERYRLDDYPFYMEVGIDSIYCEFTLGNLEEIDLMHGELKLLPRFRNSADRYRSGGTLIFAEQSPTLAVQYRAVQLEGGLQMTLRISITPGARLFYAADGDFETEVDDIHIDENGTVRMPIAVREGQRYIYGRTVLGDVMKCIRIYIFTGETEEISLSEYKSRVRIDPEM